MSVLQLKRNIKKKLQRKFQYTKKKCITKMYKIYYFELKISKLDNKCLRFYLYFYLHCLQAVPLGRLPLEWQQGEKKSRLRLPCPPYVRLPATVQLHNCTTAQLYNCLLYNCTTVQLHNCSTVQPANCTTAQLYNCTTVQLYNCTT